MGRSNNSLAESRQGAKNKSYDFFAPWRLCARSSFTSRRAIFCQPGEHFLVPVFAVLGLQHPLPFVGEVENFRVVSGVQITVSRKVPQGQRINLMNFLRLGDFAGVPHFPPAWPYFSH